MLFAKIDARSGTRIVPGCPALGAHFKKASVVHAEDVPVGPIAEPKSSAAKQSSQPLLLTEGYPSLYRSIEILPWRSLRHEPILLAPKNL
jgi:hypothetical protein